MSNVDWILVIILIIAVLQEVLSVLQARTDKKVDSIIKSRRM